MMAPTEEDLEELSDKEFQRILVTMFKQFINVPPENENKELKEIRKSTQDGKMKFNKKIDLQKKTQTEMRIEVRNSITRIKIFSESSTNRMNHMQTAGLDNEEEELDLLLKIND